MRREKIELLRFDFTEGYYENQPSFLLLMNGAECKVYPKKFYTEAEARALGREYIAEYERMGIQVTYFPDPAVSHR
ncbi:MAG TPA: hypothetical protein VF646_13920 [Cytophagales bacterium]|jgi:hypothetical protein